MWPEVDSYTLKRVVTENTEIVHMWGSILLVFEGFINENTTGNGH
jgi:hypothetical protein